MVTLLRPCIIRQIMIIFRQYVKTEKFCSGGRFCSLDQTHSECESTLVEVMSFCPRNRVTTTKKRSSPRFGTTFSRSFWDLFVLKCPFLANQPALKSRWGDAKPRWWDANSRWGKASPASPLQFKCCL